MKRKILVIVIMLFATLMQSQDYSALWEGHYSYLNIKDTSRGENKIYAAAENAIFTYDINTFEIEKISTINGLSGETISTIHYSQDYGLLLIGYDNGLIEIVVDGEVNVLTVVDILDKPTIPPTNKRINHFNEYNGVVYIATDFGISVYDLTGLEFGDTYYIGDNGAQIRVEQTTVNGGYIYAACFDNNGIKQASVASDNLIDFQEWNTISGGNFVSVQEHLGSVFAVRANRRVYRIENGVLNQLTILNDPILDVKSNDDYLLITTQNDVYVYDVNFNLILNPTFNEELNTSFTSASFHSGFLYIGTESHGVLKTDIDIGISYEELHPLGPLANTPFSILAQYNSLWVTYGDYNYYHTPTPFKNQGFSRLTGDEWLNVPFENVLGARNLGQIDVNPLNASQVFISAPHFGILEVNNNEPTILYDESNSGLESLVVPSAPNYKSIRLDAKTFDTSGVLWSLTARIEEPLKSYNPDNGQWNSYDFTSLIPDGFNGEIGYNDIVIDFNNTKWIASVNNGVIVFRENNGNQQLINIALEEQNMPSAYVNTLAFDQNNQLWIGTLQGLRVLYNTGNIFQDEAIEVQSIIVEQDGLPSELLYQQAISDIEVDGANNKWVGVTGSGLFYFSSGGQETIFHFTKDNSPLPSNNIMDVSIDDDSGKVYIATDKGLLAYGSGSSGTEEDFEEAFVYPNPVRPDFNMAEKKVKFRGLPENVNIKITDIEGNLVAEAQSNVNLRYKGYHLEIDGGSAFWDGKNLGNNTVASGVYLVMLTDLDSLETKVLKIMVIR
ncbi:type IX secretion system anionic LPS delivery protein PorZ [Mangrovimonas spongiae]|uniref:ABC transporter substrate-binding protein n=1 Tax=Mangrovimonas spongiae TaxID=2494697 RepID=A0A428K5G3_9FLAO|nr:two-component regulator propeller domain-containing protein [Mangrovimonas spongiae]RSK41678.1 ABC transporter substrate-binding protein [Mangrovimonas spongiae]